MLLFSHALFLFDQSRARCAGARRSCSFNGVYMPRITTEKFYAIENFFYTAEFFDFHRTKDTQRSFMAAMVDAGQKYCAQDWEETLAQHPKVCSFLLILFVFHLYLGADLCLLRFHLSWTRYHTTNSPSTASRSHSWSGGCALASSSRRPNRMSKLSRCECVW